MYILYLMFSSFTAKPVLRIDPARQVARQGDSPTVQCQVVEGDRPYEIVWYREPEETQGEGGSASQSIPPPLPAHITHNGDGLLRFCTF